MVNELRRISWEVFREMSLVDRMSFEGAVEYNDATVYRKNGYMHRVDGPAVIPKDLRYKEEFWLDGRKLERREFLVKTTKLGKALYGN